MLEWAAVPSSRSSRPRDRTLSPVSPALAGRDLGELGPESKKKLTALFIRIIWAHV